MIAFVSGGLDAAAREAAEHHLDDCSTCRALVAELARSPQDSLRGVAQPALPTIEPERYTTLSEHARGGQGRVLLVHDRSTGREVALKRLQTDDEAHRRRFVRAARIASQLDHPNILPVHDLGLDEGGAPFMTMPFVRGETLAERLSKAVSMTERLRLLEPFVAVCRALAYAHARGVVHRDIKPNNVMIGAFGETLLLDWGLAKVPDDVVLVEALALERADDQTLEGALLGTPAYMSPEQLGGAPASARSDIWSLGVMLYELLAGARPFAGELSQMRSAILEGRYAPLRERCPEVPPELAAVVERCLAQPDARFESATQLADELSAFRAGARLSVYEYSTAELLLRLVRRHTLSAALLVLTVLSLVGALVVSWTYQRKEQRARLAADQRLGQLLLDRAERLDVQRRRAPARLYAAGALAASSSPQAELETSARSILYQTDFEPVPRLLGLFPMQGIVTSVALDATRRVLASSADGQVALIEQGKLRIIASAQGWVTQARFGPPGALWVTAKGALFRRSLHGALRSVTSSLSSGLRALAVHGDKIAVAGDDGVVRLLDPQGAQLAQLRGHTQAVIALAFSPDGAMLASASEDRTTRLWRVADGAQQAVLQGHQDPVYGVAFSPDGARLATAAWDRTVRLWSVPQGRQLRRLEGHQDAVVAVSFSPDGRALASASHDGTVRLWATDTGRLSLVIDGHRDGVTSVAFGPAGERLATASRDQRVRIFELKRARDPVTLRGHDNWIYGLAQRDDRLVSVGWDGQALLWRWSVPKAPIARWRGLGSSAFCAAIAPDGQTIATGGQSGEIRLHDAQGALKATLPGHQGTVYALLYTPDSALISGGWDGTVKVWSPGGTTPRLTLRAQGPKVYGLALSKNGLLAVAGQQPSVQLFELSSGRLVRTLPHPSWTSGVSFSKQGDRLATSGKDGVIRIFEGPELQERFSLTGHAQWVNQVRLSGPWLLSTSDDRSVRLWSLKARRAFLRLRTEGPAVAADFSPDARAVIIAEYGRIRRFPLELSPRQSPKALLQDAERALGRTLEEELSPRPGH